MRRRAFILGGAAGVLAAAARAQHSARVWRMGFIAHGHESFYDALFEGLRDLGYEQATKFELTVNLKTAKAIRLTIPDPIVAIADTVIE